MPLVLQFAHRFSSAVREYIKRISQSSFRYYTSSSSHYSKQVGFVPFAQFPSMPKPCKNSTVTRQQLDEMRTWTAEYGQSVRQQTVRNMTTNDSAGTLPLNCYESKEADPKPEDFAELARGEQEIIANEDVAPTSVPEVVVFEGTFVCVKHCRQLYMQPSLFNLARLDENLYATEKAKAKVTHFAQDPLLPFQFVETTAAGELDRASIVSIVMNPTKEDDTVILGDDAYYCLPVDALDNGDTRAVSELLEEETEQDDDMQSEDDALPVITRSGRRSDL